jgi:hypothetical protein
MRNSLSKLTTSTLLPLELLVVAAGVLAPPVAVAVFAAGVVEAAVEAGVG